MINKIKESFADISPDSRLGKIGQKMVRENQEILDRFIAGVRAAADNAAYTENTTDVGGVRMQSRIGTTEDGRGIYKTNYQENTPKSVKQQEIIDLVQNVWSKNPITLTVIENGIERKNIAIFNPELSDRSDLSKIAFGNRKGNASEKRITLDLSSDLYQIAEDSQYVKSKEETGKKDNPAHDDVKQWHYFVTDLVFEEADGTQIDCYMNIDVKEKTDGDWFYSFAIEKGTAPQTLLAAVTDKSATVPTDIIPDYSEKGNTSDEKRLDQSRDDDYLSAVNRGDMETAQRMVDEAAERAFADSKIRGEDGKLVKVYHGTDADFTVFDRTMGRSNMDIQGLFFSPWGIDAGGYGPNVRAFYLNITNPADERTGYKALNAHKCENYAGIKAREDLEKAGYDGVNNSDEEYIAFTSEQIKSADPVTYDDNGEVIPLSERFNSEKEDIRYQERGGDLFEDDDLSFGEYDDISDVTKRQYTTHSEAIGEVLKTQRILLL